MPAASNMSAFCFCAASNLRPCGPRGAFTIRGALFVVAAFVFVIVIMVDSSSGIAGERRSTHPQLTLSLAELSGCFPARSQASRQLLPLHRTDRPVRHRNSA